MWYKYTWTHTRGYIIRAVMHRPLIFQTPQQHPPLWLYLLFFSLLLFVPIFSHL